MTKRYPWYDSSWLSSYVNAKSLIKQNCPEKYELFTRTFDPLRTRTNFETIKISSVFDQSTLAKLKNLIKTLQEQELEKHEFFRFGRFVVHDHPFIQQIQAEMVDLVSDHVGEKVEPSYSFLSLYHNFGVCAVHMDSPSAKWTLDVCIDQSHP